MAAILIKDLAAPAPQRCAYLLGRLVRSQERVHKRLAPPHQQKSLFWMERSRHIQGKPPGVGQERGEFEDLGCIWLAFTQKGDGPPESRHGSLDIRKRLNEGG